ncbi:hypothetical protein D9613_012902 [Agrocybe pediades]|uniref:Uncharacterized protein n=1 Tax=Agrocybe pediades TaxID=84607 RepID=A0A8H4QRE8_9AGAR|nr:hypothetical protein D9613_012902 [Agrocybe pediades]
MSQMHRPLPAPDPRSQASNSRLKYVEDVCPCSFIAIRSIVSDAHGHVAFIDSHLHIFTSSGSTRAAFDRHETIVTFSTSSTAFLFPPVNGYSSIDAAPTVISAGVKGRREDTAIPPPLPPPAFPAMMGYYPTSVVPAGMCSFPENSVASPPSTRPSLQRI